MFTFSSLKDVTMHEVQQRVITWLQMCGVHRPYGLTVDYLARTLNAVPASEIAAELGRLSASRFFGIAPYARPAYWDKFLGNPFSYALFTFIAVEGPKKFLEWLARLRKEAPKAFAELREVLLRAETDGKLVAPFTSHPDLGDPFGEYGGALTAEEEAALRGEVYSGAKSSTEAFYKSIFGG